MRTRTHKLNALCVICFKRPKKGTLMCGVCGRSYDRSTAKDDGTIDSVIRWAASHARKYERQRAPKRGVPFTITPACPGC